MGIVVNMHRTGLFRVVKNTDQVIASAPIPPGGRLISAQGQFHILTDSILALNNVVSYGIGGYVVPVLDPDTPVTVDTLWDTLIEKDDTAAADLDLDTADADTDPEYEVGSPNIQRILQINATETAQVFKRRRWLTLASHPQNVHFDNTLKFIPGEVVPVSVNKQVAVNAPSMLLFGFSSPNLDVTTTGLESTPTEQQWGFMSYMKSTVMDMVKDALVAFEAGAETPYAEAAALISKLLEDTAIEETVMAAQMVAVDFQVLVDMTIQVLMPEQSDLTQLTAS